MKLGLLFLCDVIRTADLSYILRPLQGLIQGFSLHKPNFIEHFPPKPLFSQKQRGGSEKLQYEKAAWETSLLSSGNGGQKGIFSSTWTLFQEEAQVKIVLLGHFDLSVSQAVGDLHFLSPLSQNVLVSLFYLKKVT